MPVIHSTTDTFETDLEGDIVIVYVSTGWCGPCRQLAPIIEDLSNQYADKVKVLKIDADRDKSIAQAYNVTSVPTLLIFKNKIFLKREIGFSGKKHVEDLFKNL